MSASNDIGRILPQKDGPYFTIKDERCEFAKAALIGLLACPEAPPQDIEQKDIYAHYANRAYRFADAMLAERSKP